MQGLPPPRAMKCISRAPPSVERGAPRQDPDQGQLAEEGSMPTDKQHPWMSDPRGAHGERKEGWFSDMLEMMWPHVQNAVNSIAREMLPVLLHNSKPSWIASVELRNFTLGPEAPDILNITSHRARRGASEEIYLEADMQWRSEQDFQLFIRPLPKGLVPLVPEVAENIVKRWFNVTVGVTNLEIRNRIRITLRPLLDETPVVGALLVSLVGEPQHLDFKLTLNHHTQMALLPAVKTWLHGFVKDTLLTPYTLPEYYLYKIKEDAEVLETPEGLVEVHVPEARNVPKGDWFSASEPFVEVFVRQRTQRRTEILPTTRHACWKDNTFLLPVHVKAHQNVTAVLYDWDQYSGNDELGRVVVSLHDFKPGETRDLWLEPLPPGHEAAEQQAMEDRDEHGALGTALNKLHVKKKSHKEKKGDVCQLHIKVTWHEFTEDDVRALQEASSSAGDTRRAMLNPRVRMFAEMGTVNIKVGRVEALPAHTKPWYMGGWSKAIKVKVRLGEAEKQSQPVTARRSAPVNQELQIEVTSERHMDDLHSALASQNGASQSQPGPRQNGEAAQPWDDDTRQNGAAAQPLPPHGQAGAHSLPRRGNALEAAFALPGPAQQPAAARAQDEKEQRTLELEVWEVHWFNRLVGRLEFSLASLKASRRTKGTWRLQSEAGEALETRIELELEWVSYLSGGSRQ